MCISSLTICQHRYQNRQNDGRGKRKRLTGEGKNRCAQTLRDSQSQTLVGNSGLKQPSVLLLHVICTGNTVYISYYIVEKASEKKNPIKPNPTIAHELR